MRRLFFVCAVTSLLVAVGSIAWAGLNLSSSRSNIYRVTYDTTAVNPTQAAAVLKELDKSGPGATVATVRGILRKLGMNPTLTVQIVPGGQRRSGEKIPLVILVASPGDVPAALAITDEGAPSDKPTKPVKK